MATETAVIGQEANELEQVDTDLIDEAEDVETIYLRDQIELQREMLLGMPVKEAVASTGFSRRKVMYLRARTRHRTHSLAQPEETKR